MPSGCARILTNSTSITTFNLVGGVNNLVGGVKRTARFSTADFPEACLNGNSAMTRLPMADAVRALHRVADHFPVLLTEAG